jgi:hypothetical protein
MARKRTNKHRTKRLIAERQDYARRIIRGEGAVTACDAELRLRAREVYQLFRRKIAEYRHLELNPHRLAPAKQTITRLIKAVEIAQRHNVDLDTYVTAQFWWFHKVFASTPQIYQLCTSGNRNQADQRLLWYLEAKRTGSLSDKVVSNALPPEDLTKSQLNRYNERQLKLLMSRYDFTDETEVFSKLSDAVLLQFFDLEWLRSKEQYRKARKT